MFWEVLCPFVFLFLVDRIEKNKPPFFFEVFTGKIQQTVKYFFPLSSFYLTPIEFFPLLNSLFVHLFHKIFLELFFFLWQHFLLFPLYIPQNPPSLFFKLFILLLGFSQLYSFFQTFLLFLIWYLLWWLLRILLFFQIWLFGFLFFFHFRLFLFLFRLFDLLSLLCLLISFRCDSSTHSPDAIRRVSDDCVEKIRTSESKLSWIDSDQVGSGKPILLEV